jgi:hypothetical protein
MITIRHIPGMVAIRIGIPGIRRSTSDSLRDILVSSMVDMGITRAIATQDIMVRMGAIHTEAIRMEGRDLVEVRDRADGVVSYREPFFLSTGQRVFFKSPALPGFLFVIRRRT